jgi:hypothetical protein
MFIKRRHPIRWLRQATANLLPSIRSLNMLQPQAHHKAYKPAMERTHLPQPLILPPIRQMTQNVTDEIIAGRIDRVRGPGHGHARARAQGRAHHFGPDPGLDLDQDHLVTAGRLEVDTRTLENTTLTVAMISAFSIHFQLYLSR